MIDAALAAKRGPGPAIYLSARGRRLTQGRVQALAAGPGVTLLCGRSKASTSRVIEVNDLERSRSATSCCRRRARCDAVARRLRAPLPRRDGRGSLGRRGEASRADCSEYPAVYAAAACGAAAPCRGAGLGPPREHPRPGGAKRPSGRRASVAPTCGRAGGAPESPTQTRRKNEMNIMDQVEQGQIAKLTAERTIPEFGPGDTCASPQGGRGHARAHPGL